LILEYAHGGNLMQKIKDKEEINESKARDIMKQLLICIDYIHEKGVIHRDLKP
jgi:serine/threonine protein kinase